MIEAANAGAAQKQVIVYDQRCAVAERVGPRGNVGAAVEGRNREIADGVGSTTLIVDAAGAKPTEVLIAADGMVSPGLGKTAVAVLADEFIV